jgi:hypothetical protein
LEIQNAAAEIKLRAEGKAGAMLTAMELHGGDRIPKSHDVILLSDLGIHRMQSHRWQLIAGMPEEAYESEVQEALDGRRELTTATVLS